MTDAHTLAVERCLGRAGSGRVRTTDAHTLAVECCLGHAGSGVAVCGLSCSAACGIFPEQGSNLSSSLAGRFFTTGPAWVSPKITFSGSSLLSPSAISTNLIPHHGLFYHVQEARAVSPAQLSFAHNSSKCSYSPSISSSSLSFPRHAGICSPGSVPSLQTCAYIVYLSLY